MSMNTRKSSSSSEQIEETSTRLRGASLASDGGQTSRSHRSHRSNRHDSVGHNPELASIAERSTIRTHSPAESHSSATAAGIPYDSLSVISSKTGLTSVSQRLGDDSAPHRSSIHSEHRPSIHSEHRPSIHSEHRTSIHSDHRTSIPSSKRPSIHHQEHSTHRPSTFSNVGSAAKLGGGYSKPKAHFDVSKAIFAQVDTNQDGVISRDEFRTWAQPGIVTGDEHTPPPSQQHHRQSTASQQHHRQSTASQQPHRQSTASQQPHRQSLFPQQQQQQHRQSLQPPYISNPNPEQQRVNSLLGPDAFKDVALNIDYGAVEAYNVALKSSEDPTGEQIRKSSVGSVGGGGEQRFDVVKAIFNQADANHDGSIDREEFRQWATALGHPDTRPRGSRHSIHRGSTANDFNLSNAQVYEDTNPEAANILQQSGLAENYTNYA